MEALALSIPGTRAASLFNHLTVGQFLCLALSSLQRFDNIGTFSTDDHIIATAVDELSNLLSDRFAARLQTHEEYDVLMDEVETYSVFAVESLREVIHDFAGGMKCIKIIRVNDLDFTIRVV